MRRLYKPFLFGLALSLSLAGCKPPGDNKTKPGEDEDIDSSQIPAQFRGLALGTKAPEIEAEDVEGKTFQLSKYRGKVVLLDFWAVN
jgi:hypothetical protein